MKTHLLREIREMGYHGSHNLLVRYINQGRVEVDHACLSPRRVTRLLTRRPDRLREDQLALHDQIAGACPEMTALATQISSFAALLSSAPGNAAALNGWITRTRDTDLPFLHAFATGLERDRAAIDAALTLAAAQRTHRGRPQEDRTD
ncbi:hypothetical protein AB0D13_31250 [Streptomyces sp. NPDC048430]|uniref:hypothetical protein n=1 Tax=Streptomyces sp. NPDC048430 TaxID=3155388 RepID=UPI0034473243